MGSLRAPAAEAAPGAAATAGAAEEAVLWRVVGGTAKGGIVVRSGRGLGSPEEPLRLATGALVGQEELRGDRMRYRRLSGAGPDAGWVSVRLSGRALLVPAAPSCSAAELAAAAAPPPAAVPPSAAACGTGAAAQLPRAVPPRAAATLPGPGEASAVLPARPRRPGAAAWPAARGVPVPPHAAPPCGDVEASLQYLVHDGSEPFAYMYKREDGGKQIHGAFEPRTVTVTDAWLEAPSLSLDAHGVLLAPHSTALSAADFYEQPAKVWRDYYEEMRALVQRATGASQVFVFDHNIRNPQEAKWRRGVIGYVPYAHNDYTTKSGPARLLELAGASGPLAGLDPEGLLKRRFMIVNVWRNIADAPISCDPLAVADGSTVGAESYVPMDLIHRDRVGQTYSVTHDASHRWLYFSGMRRDEALLLKCYDSAEEQGIVRWTAHTGFVDPRSPPEAPTRQSIDARCLALFEEGDEGRTALPAAELFPELRRLAESHQAATDKS